MRYYHSVYHMNGLTTSESATFVAGVHKKVVSSVLMTLGISYLDVTCACQPILEIRFQAAPSYNDGEQVPEKNSYLA